MPIRDLALLCLMATAAAAPPVDAPSSNSNWLASPAPVLDVDMASFLANSDLVYAWNASNTPQPTNPMANENAVSGCVPNGPGSSGPGCPYYAIVPSAVACQAACASNSSCTAYTWHDATTGEWNGCCYFRTDGKFQPTNEAGHYSNFKPFDRPAPDPFEPSAWWNAAYIGNGLFGASITSMQGGGSNGSHLIRLDLGRTDAWNCQNRIAFAYAVLAPSVGVLQQVSMRVVLHNATLLLSATTTAGSLLSTIFVDASNLTRSVLVARSWSFGGEGAPTWTLVSDQTTTACGIKGNETHVVGDTPWGTQATLNTMDTSSGNITTGLTTASDGTVYISAQNNQRMQSPASSQAMAIDGLASAIAAGYDVVAADHSAWWGSFYNTSFWSWDTDTALESFTFIAMYRYASAARTVMHDLMGPWGPGHINLCDGPWCQYVWDMNTQVMLYLPSSAAGHPELVVPVLQQFENFNTWTATYGSNAPVCCADTLWWLANFHRHSLMYADVSIMRDTLYPWMASCVVDTIYPSLKPSSNDTYLHVMGCASPEYPMPPGQSNDCSYHLSIYRWAAGVLNATAALYYPSDSRAATFQTILARLAPLPVDPATGSIMIAAGVPFAVPHRHYSHLLAIYDLQTYGQSTAEVASAVASLITWWNITCAIPQAAGGVVIDGDYDCRGFTQAGMSKMNALLGRPLEAMGNLSAVLTSVITPNGLYGEEVFQGNPDLFAPVAESAYSTADAALKFLLSSDAPWPAAHPPVAGFNDTTAPLTVRVWPVASGVWANSSMYRMRSNGGLLVSAMRTNGNTAFVLVEAEVPPGGATGAATPFTLYLNDWAGVAASSIVVNPPSASVTAIQPGVFSVDGLVRGGAVGLSLVQMDTYAVTPSGGRNSTQFNVWGYSRAFPFDKWTR